jgi:hypothetical protein
MNRLVSHRRTLSGIAALVGGIVLSTPTDAWAYIDPGTGSYMFQIAAAGMFGAVYTVRRWWHVLASAIRPRGARVSRPGEPRR